LAWGEVDWFEPSATTDDEAIPLFREHNRLAHAFAPDLFDAAIELRVIAGQWNEFGAWCERVRGKSWDWKFGALKKLSRMHAMSHGWSLDGEAAHVAPGASSARRAVLAVVRNYPRDVAGIRAQARCARRPRGV
jgi:hypothetical protein